MAILERDDVLAIARNSSLVSHRDPRPTLGKLAHALWCVDHPEVVGVFVGGCVCRGVGSKFRAKAHAHIRGPRRGWICFRSARWLHVRELWLHELAHVVTRSGHDRRWREFLVQVGGTLDPVVDPATGEAVLRSYHPRKLGVRDR